jgi:hypothetical protein
MSNNGSQRIAVFPQQAGESRWWFGGLALIKLTGAQTEGRYSLIEMLWPPNLEVPLHVHARACAGEEVGVLSFFTGLLE